MILTCTTGARLTMVQSAKHEGSWDLTNRLSPPLLIMHRRRWRIRHPNPIGTPLWHNRRRNRGTPARNTRNNSLTWSCWLHHRQLLDLVIFPLRRSRLSFFKRPILGISLLLLILGHEPIKGALLLHKLSLVLLLIGLPGANLQSL